VTVSPVDGGTITFEVAAGERARIRGDFRGGCIFHPFLKAFAGFSSICNEKKWNNIL
jgi:hypothetical protein